MLANFQGNSDRGKRREALGVDHKRLLYCVNVNRTSLDHLLLGENADIDELSNVPSIAPEEREAGRISFKSHDARFGGLTRRLTLLPSGKSEICR